MKTKLRAQFKNRRVAPAASAAIQKMLLAQDWWAAGFQVGLYRAVATEPATDLLLADLLARGAQVAVPRREKNGYVWSWVDATTRWVAGAHGIMEPALRVPAAAAELRIIVVPGVAFDRAGGRLGHGTGHYDRLLAGSDALRVGLCDEARLVTQVPMDAHDARMDLIVTEKQVRFMAGAEEKLARLTG
ncbi:MAG: 5-formyltetrahydrofolate cyclo-ligase [Kiritimatiellae bacterium]|nr:5-formyltetrahydrofolate cyclo-ligase [Kiritimatiellia bacterium]